VHSLPRFVASDTVYLYAFGGMADSTTARSNFTKTKIVITALFGKTRERQSVSAWSAGSSNLAVGRYRMMASIFDSTLAPNLNNIPSGNRYVFIGPGNGAVGSTNGTDSIDLGQVQTDGTVNLIPATGNISTGARQGPCMFLYASTTGAMGLIGGGSSGVGTSGSMTATSTCGSTVCPSVFGSWTPMSTISPEPSNVKCVVAGPFVFLAGGVAGGAAIGDTFLGFV